MGQFAAGEVMDLFEVKISAMFSSLSNVFMPLAIVSINALVI